MRKFVFVAALAILAWIVVVPSRSTEFGCEATGAIAHGEDGECPSSIEEAAGDAQWATVASARTCWPALSTRSPGSSVQPRDDP